MSSSECPVSLCSHRGLRLGTAVMLMMVNHAVVLYLPVALPAYALQWDEVVQRWPDGSPRILNTLDGDGRDGIIVKRKTYFESGNIQMEMELTYGMPHGHFIRYYKNGNKQMEGDARDGKLHGH